MESRAKGKLTVLLSHSDDRTPLLFQRLLFQYQTEMENMGREEMFLKGCGWEYCLIQRAAYV